MQSTAGRTVSINPAEACGRGTQRTFSGENLREIAFPLGGIGTGTVSLGGRGNLRDWEIFNRPGKGIDLPFTFFAIWTCPEGGEPVARVLERRLLPPYVAAGGLPSPSAAGLPRLAEARFTGAYPFAHLAFEDDRLPIQVELEAFNPFVPLDAETSGMPVAVFRWRLRNPGSRAMRATVALSLLNAVGFGGQGHPDRRAAQFGGNVNRWRQEDGVTGLFMTGRKPEPGDPGAGSLAVATTWPETTFVERWERSGWFDALQSFWDGFRAGGRLGDERAPSDESAASPDGLTDVGTMGLVAAIPPGGEVVLPIVLGWHFPNLVNYWNREPGVAGQRLGNEYANRFADAWGTAAHVATRLEDLRAVTRKYHDALFETTLPPAVLDAVSSQVSTIRTTTCLRTSDGRFHAFEGCNDNAGCCPMNCTHVWNYEHSLAHLFPSLERTMRETDFQTNTRPSGDMAFRTLLPVLSGELWSFRPAADGQMGCILKLYREWKLSGDSVFLRALWPAAKRALEFAWRGGWDADRDGVMEGEQHNTYDIEFYGPNSMMGTLYLGALRAAEEMASALGEQAVAASYRELFVRGSERLDAALWNGEFFVQRVTRPSGAGGPTLGAGHPASLQGDEEPRYQYGPGCLSDALLGQWFARVVGLGDLLPSQHIRACLASIVRYNWRSNLSAHESCQRTYALNDEAGLLLCTWPKGGRPRYPFPYADEVWTGIEYQVAAHLIYEGMVADGLAIVEGARHRHDGRRRNPWDEFECGHHYARAMSSWSLLLALSGYYYDATVGMLGFAPCIQPERFRCFFSTGTSWGSFAQADVTGGRNYQVEPRYGAVTLRSLRLDAGQSSEVRAVRGSESLATTQERADEGLIVRFATSQRLQAGEVLTVTVAR